jgi:hypothetical protein
MWVAGTHSFRLDDSVIKQKLAPGTIRRIIRFPADGARSTTGVRGDACRRPPQSWQVAAGTPGPP